LRLPAFMITNLGVLSVRLRTLVRAGSAAMSSLMKENLILLSVAATKSVLTAYRASI